MVASLEGEEEERDEIIYDGLHDIADKAGINGLFKVLVHCSKVLSNVCVSTLKALPATMNGGALNSNVLTPRIAVVRRVFSV